MLLRGSSARHFGQVAMLRPAVCCCFFSSSFATRAFSSSYVGSVMRPAVFRGVRVINLPLDPLGLGRNDTPDECHHAPRRLQCRLSGRGISAHQHEFVLGIRVQARLDRELWFALEPRTLYCFLESFLTLLKQHVSPAVSAELGTLFVPVVACPRKHYLLQSHVHDLIALAFPD